VLCSLDERGAAGGNREKGFGSSVKQVVKVRLRVGDAFHDDMYKDLARVHWRQRGTPTLKVGSIVKIAAQEGGERFVALYGLEDNREGEILLDFVNRGQLNVELNRHSDFTIATTNPWEKLKWACSATDPAPRIAAWIAVWSGILGIIGILLGLYPILFENKHETPMRSEAPLSAE
jgi:hypothetical protein